MTFLEKPCKRLHAIDITFCKMALPLRGQTAREALEETKSGNETHSP
jgi:hypothetical protein